MDWNHLLGTSELADIVGRLNGDGHLQLRFNKHGNPDKYLVSFYSKNIDEINDMIRKFKNLFNVDYCLYPDDRKTKRYKLFFVNKNLALFLSRIGVVVGSKSNNPHLVPEWIFNGNNEVKGAFLKGLFDTEGSIFFERYNNRWRMSINQHKIKNEKKNGFEYFNQIRKMLADFGVKSSPVRSSPSQGNTRKTGIKTVQVKISIEKGSFRNFYKYVGFDNIYKQSRLITALTGESPSSKATDVPKEQLSLQLIGR